MVCLRNWAKFCEDISLPYRIDTRILQCLCYEYIYWLRTSVFRTAFTQKYWSRQQGWSPEVIFKFNEIDLVIEWSARVSEGHCFSGMVEGVVQWACIKFCLPPCISLLWPHVMRDDWLSMEKEERLVYVVVLIELVLCVKLRRVARIMYVIECKVTRIPWKHNYVLFKNDKIICTQPRMTD